MMRCPLCQAQVPEVVGASSQVCAQCGAEVPVEAAPVVAPSRADNAGAVSRAFRAVFQDYGAWLALYMPFALLALAVEVAGLLATGFDGTTPTAPGEVAILVAVTLPFLVLQFGLGAAFMGVGAAVTAAAVLEGRRVRPRDGLAIVRARGPLLLGAGATFVAVLFAGAIPLVVPAFFFLHRYLWTTAFVAEGRSPGEAFAASRGLAMRPGMKATTFVIVLAWLAVILVRYSLGALVAQSFGGVCGEAGVASSCGELLTAVASAVVGIPLLPFVPALVGSCLVAARADAGGATPVSASVACPGCGRPVAYVPAAGPQVVTCGHCGRAGTVR